MRDLRGGARASPCVARASPALLTHRNPHTRIAPTRLERVIKRSSGVSAHGEKATHALADQGRSWTTLIRAGAIGRNFFYARSWKKENQKRKIDCRARGGERRAAPSACAAIQLPQLLVSCSCSPQMHPGGFVCPHVRCAASFTRALQLRRHLEQFPDHAPLSATAAYSSAAGAAGGAEAGHKRRIDESSEAESGAEPYGGLHDGDDGMSGDGNAELVTALLPSRGWRDIPREDDDADDVEDEEGAETSGAHDAAIASELAEAAVLGAAAASGGMLLTSRKQLAQDRRLVANTKRVELLQLASASALTDAQLTEILRFLRRHGDRAMPENGASLRAWSQRHTEQRGGVPSAMRVKLLQVPPHIQRDATLPSNRLTVAAAPLAAVLGNIVSCISVAPMGGFVYTSSLLPPDCTPDSLSRHGFPASPHGFACLRAAMEHVRANDRAAYEKGDFIVMLLQVAVDGQRLSFTKGAIAADIKLMNVWDCVASSGSAQATLALLDKFAVSSSSVAHQRAAQFMFQLALEECVWQPLLTLMADGFAVHVPHDAEWALPRHRGSKLRAFPFLCSVVGDHPGLCDILAVNINSCMWCSTAPKRFDKRIFSQLRPPLRDDKQWLLVGRTWVRQRDAAPENAADDDALGRFRMRAVGSSAAAMLFNVHFAAFIGRLPHGFRSLIHADSLHILRLGWIKRVVRLLEVVIKRATAHRKGNDAVARLHARAALLPPFTDQHGRTQVAFRSGVAPVTGREYADALPVLIAAFSNDDHVLPEAEVLGADQHDDHALLGDDTWTPAAAAGGADAAAAVSATCAVDDAASTSSGVDDETDASSDDDDTGRSSVDSSAEDSGAPALGTRDELHVTSRDVVRLLEALALLDRAAVGLDVTTPAEEAQFRRLVQR